MHLVFTIQWMGWPCVRGSLLIESVWPVACRVWKALGSIKKYTARPTSSANRKVTNKGTVGGICTFTTYEDGHLIAQKSWKRLD